MYDVIKDFEKYWRWFNRDAASSEQILIWAESMGLHCIEDRQLDYGFAAYLKGERLVFYNPHLPEAEKILVIGHEVGHQLLGHTAYLLTNSFSQPSLFEKTGMEKDASIIGYLCMIPSSSLLKLLQEERLSPETLHSKYLHLWSDLAEDYSFRLCEARIRIFNALLGACRRRGVRGLSYLKGRFGFEPALTRVGST